MFEGQNCSRMLTNCDVWALKMPFGIVSWSPLLLFGVQIVYLILNSQRQVQIIESNILQAQRAGHASGIRTFFFFGLDLSQL